MIIIIKGIKNLLISGFFVCGASFIFCYNRYVELAFYKTMKKIIYYLPRALSILVVGFFAIFILEGFGPEFTWRDSLMHGLLALAVLIITLASWKWPKIGGWIFIVFGLRYLLSASGLQWWLFIIGGIPLIVGILFLIEGFKKKENV